MGVQVDKPRHHQAAGGRQRLAGPLRIDVGLDRGDLTMADADVAPSAQRVRGVDDVTAGDDEIEAILGAHHRCGQRGAGRQRRRHGPEAGQATGSA